MIGKSSATLMLASVLFSASVQYASSNGIPPDDMLYAETPEEFFAAESKHRTAKNQAPKERVFRASAEEDMEYSHPILAEAFNDEPGFYYGVASGDPLPDAVVLWTKYTPISSDDSVTLELRIAEIDSSVAEEDHLDPDKNSNLMVAQIEIDSSSDYIAKVDITGLKSNTHYLFAFHDGNVASQVGSTKTAPKSDDDVSSLTYAFFSCSHFANGYFHSYDIASTIKDLDFWIHVGDYIYEYGEYSSYASDSSERKEMILPKWEIVDVQDYRNRYATYHLDEGIQNLRRSAPLIATWDDHETTNNAYGKGLVENTGAENHQEFCPVNRTASNDDKEEAGCDTDEGNIKARLDAAAQAYMEWLPLRRGPGSMGVVDITSITQVIEWGNLASVVTLDSRISQRSAEPTLASVFGEFYGTAYVSTNISAYYDMESVERQTFESIAAGVKAKMEDPAFSMIGDTGKDVVLDVFEKSKAASKPWQIFAAATMMGPNVPLNVDQMSNYADPEVAPFVKDYTDVLLPDAAAVFLRAATAMAVTLTPWNRDDWNGFAKEREDLLDGFKTKSNNPIVLGGDLHDSWAWTLYSADDGSPTAVNLGAPGVTSPGWGPYLYGFFAPLAESFGDDFVFKLIADTFVGTNNGLVFADVQKKGFVAVKVTKDEHIAEYTLIDPEVTLTDYDTARSISGSITSDFKCHASLVTTAGMPGSLEKSECGAIEYMESHPTWMGLTVSTSMTESATMLSACDYNACQADADTMMLRNEAPTPMPTKKSKKAKNQTKSQKKDKKAKGKR